MSDESSIHRGVAAVSPPLSKAHYRPEIDGLRALAVLAVVLYHARVPGLSGGFAGVDVFFAISGYVVMLALRREQASTGRIDWMRFLVRRVRRLLPMLLVTIAIALQRLAKNCTYVAS